MARPKNPDTEITDVPVPAVLIGSGRSHLNELAKLENEAELRTHDLAVKLGYDGPLDPDLIQRGLVFQMRRTVETCLETGRALLILKERVGHGNFLERLREVQIEPRMAQRFMQAAMRFPNTTSKVAFGAAIGSQTKLLELLVLDDNEIKQLAEDGFVGDIQLDAIEHMSVSELKAKLREREQDIGAKDKVIAKRDQKIAKLEERLDRPWQSNVQSVAQNAEEAAALDALGEATNEIDVTFTKLGMSAAVLQDNPREAVRGRALQAVQYLVARMRDVIVENGLEVPIGEDAFGVRPAWLDYKA